MATEMINIRLEKDFLKEIDRTVKKEHYQSRTELIRQSLRDKIEERKMKETILRLRGILKTNKQTTDKELEKIRENVFKEKFSKFK